jgi:AcrR family transcriptional regulator
MHTLSKMSRKKRKSSKPVKKAAEPCPAIETPEWLPALTDPRDEEILGAAFCTFTELGFHGATMLEIAKRARASKTTLYERFRDKEGLFQALLEWGASN